MVLRVLFTYLYRSTRWVSFSSLSPFVKKYLVNPGVSLFHGVYLGIYFSDLLKACWGCSSDLIHGYNYLGEIALLCIDSYAPRAPGTQYLSSCHSFGPLFMPIKFLLLFIKVISWIYFQTFSIFACHGIWQFYFCLSNLCAPFSSCASGSCFTCWSLERRLFDS